MAGILKSMSEALGGSMAGNVANNLSGNGLLMQTAKQKGQQMAASRGLQNSTLGIEASQRAMVDAAIPIAQIDTQNRHQTQMQNSQNQFVAGQAGLDRSHQLGMQSEDYRQRGILAELANRHDATQSALNRSHQAEMANINHRNAMTELSAQVSANTVGKSIDFVQQIANNFDAQIAAVLNNTNMTKEDKANAIATLQNNRKTEMNLMNRFMRHIPTTRKDWAIFPDLEIPQVNFE